MEETHIIICLKKRNQNYKNNLKIIMKLIKVKRLDFMDLITYATLLVIYC